MGSYVNEVFPLGIAKASRGGPRMSVAITESPDSGAQERSRRWANYRWEYEAGIGIQKNDVLDLAYAHHLAVGPENSFPFLDPRDFTSAANNRNDPASTGTLDQVIGVGDGTNATFQLIKTYVLGGRAYVRNIRKPLSAQSYLSVDGTTKTAQVYVSVSGVLQVLGTDYTLDTSTGILLFLPGHIPAAAAIVRASFVFYVPTFYGADFSYKVSCEAVQAGRLVELPLIEDVGPSALTPEWPYLGGGDTITLTSSRLYDYNWGRTVFLNPSADGFVITLPDLNEIPFGGEILTFANLAVSGPKTITFKNRATAATEYSLTFGKWGRLYCRKDTGDVRAWTALGQ